MPEVKFDEPQNTSDVFDVSKNDAMVERNCMASKATQYFEQIYSLYYVTQFNYWPVLLQQRQLFGCLSTSLLRHCNNKTFDVKGGFNVPSISTGTGQF